MSRWCDIDPLVKQLYPQIVRYDIYVPAVLYQRTVCEMLYKRNIVQQVANSLQLCYNRHHYRPALP